MANQIIQGEMSLYRSIPSNKEGMLELAHHHFANPILTDAKTAPIIPNSHSLCNRSV
jgi:hypothetical protein